MTELTIWAALLCFSPDQACMVMPVAYGSEKNCRLDWHNDKRLRCVHAKAFWCKDNYKCDYEPASVGH